MDESLTQRHRVEDEGLRVVNSFCQALQGLANKPLLTTWSFSPLLTQWGPQFLGLDLARSINLTVCWKLLLRLGYSQTRVKISSQTLKNLRDSMWVAEQSAGNPDLIGGSSETIRETFEKSIDEIVHVR